MLYGKQTLTMAEVKVAFISKELPRRLEGKEEMMVKASQLGEDIKRGITRIQEENP